eukprot:TRINITY_DN112_c0_g1_i1.p1 TRINITY_DN112_c0_g1~~TRINITY_DN112_c0_g1_i1.p1  ORF type:complete len:322 (-),score=57.27 TRINITY_DN112_c0_g1_i1:53-1018(-)
MCIRDRYQRRVRGLSAKMALLRVALLFVLVVLCAAQEYQPVCQKLGAPDPSFWTEERMRNAIPRDIVLDAPSNLGEYVPNLQATCPSYADCCSLYDKTDEESLYTKAPFNAVGKVFFTWDSVSMYVCSASLGYRDGKLLVWTAGHCTHSLADGFAKQWVFHPGYFNGTSKYGSFAATTLCTTTSWSKSEDMAYDYALAEVSGTLSTDVQPLELLTNYTPSALSTPFVSHGYPQGEPFNGMYENLCTSGFCNWDSWMGNGEQTFGIRCSSTGGCSGGPWIVDGNKIASVNSYKYNVIIWSELMYGPLFTDGTAQFFEKVKAL